MSQTLTNPAFDRTPCNNCGGPNDDPRFRACASCRADWRERSRKPDGPTAKLEVAHAALKLALPVMRADLCCMVESCCRSDIGPVNDHTPPQPRSMDETMLPYAKACIAAINAANSQVETPADGQPEWLDQVIAGRIKL